MGHQKRKAPRFPFTARVQYDQPGALVVQTSRDLSRSGVFIRTPSPLPVGTSTRLTLHLPGGDQVVEAVVTRSGAEGMGLAFVFATPEARAELGRLIDQVMWEGMGDALFVRLPAASEES